MSCVSCRLPTSRVLPMCAQGYIHASADATCIKIARSGSIHVWGAWCCIRNMDAGDERSSLFCKRRPALRRVVVVQKSDEA